LHGSPLIDKPPDSVVPTDTDEPAVALDRDRDGWTEGEGDCDDPDPELSPGAQELCSDRDDDCDGAVDGPRAQEHGAWCPDDDGDAHDRTEDRVEDCWPGGGWTAASGDCEDGGPGVHPEAEELCGDGLDNDCDGTWGDCSLDGDVGLAGATGRILGTTTRDTYLAHRPLGGQDWTQDGVPDVIVRTCRADGDPLSFHSVNYSTGTGDLDGDRRSDVAFRSGTGTGAVALFSGATRGTVTQEDASALLLEGVHSGHAGTQRGSVDFDGDGLADSFNPGATYLLLGPVTGELQLEDDRSGRTLRRQRCSGGGAPTGRPTYCTSA
jgi:hypothetical protein